jgi:hypothetical protein
MERSDYYVDPDAMLECFEETGRPGFVTRCVERFVNDKETIRTYFILNFANVNDALTTIMNVSRDGIGVEGNPVRNRVAYEFLSNGQYTEYALYKSAAMASLLVPFSILYHYKPKLAKGLLYGGAVLYTLVDVWNIVRYMYPGVEEAVLKLF